jgi:hypothetical protein
MDLCDLSEQEKKRFPAGHDLHTTTAFWGFLEF